MLSGEKQFHALKNNWSVRQIKFISLLVVLKSVYKGVNHTQSCEEEQEKMRQLGSFWRVSEPWCFYVV